MSNWRTGGHYPGLVVRLGEDDLKQVGNCWMAGRLRVGDLCMCLEHNGDCFWNYILLEPIDNATRGIPESKFGAYVLGTPTATQLTARQFHLIAAGEWVNGVVLKEWK